MKSKTILLSCCAGLLHVSCSDVALAQIFVQGPGAQASPWGIAIGSQADATGNAAIAIGNAAVSTANRTIAIGIEAQATGNQSVAYGNASNALATNGIAIGYRSKVDVDGEGSVAVGTNAYANGRHSSAYGPNSRATGDQSAAFGSGSQAQGAESTAIGYNAVASHGNSVALGTRSQTSRGAANNYDAPYLNTPQSSAGEVSVGRRGAERQITNVAAGVEDTDAVNVAQLRGAVDYITQDIDRVFGDIHRLGIEIDAAKDLARAAGAIGLAASQIRYDDRPGKLSLGVGVGSFSGQNALTVGLGYTSQDLTWRANVSGGVAGSETGIGAGISFTLN